jgi:hypothetical protein
LWLEDNVIWRRWAGITLCCGLAVLLTLACGSDSDRGSANILADLAEQARRAGADQQAEVLVTGSVDDDDLLAAVLAARECVRELGVRVDPVTRNVFGGLTYGFGILVDETELLARADACQDQHAKFVQLGYDRLNPPAPNLGVSEVRACLAAAGESLPADVDTFDALSVAAEGASGSTLEDCYYSFLFAVTVVVE